MCGGASSNCNSSDMIINNCRWFSLPLGFSGLYYHRIGFSFPVPRSQIISSSFFGAASLLASKNTIEKVRRPFRVNKSWTLTSGRGNCNKNTPLSPPSLLFFFFFSDGIISRFTRLVNFPPLCFFCSADCGDAEVITGICNLQQHGMKFQSLH